MTETKSSDLVYLELHRIAELAQRRSGDALTTLAHSIDVNFLREAFGRIRKSVAPGVDGQTAEQYAEELEENLESLLDRFKTGSYRAPALRRSWIPKGNGEKRPIGIPTVEDKILQRAVTMVLQEVYEQDFLPCSFGYRPGRSAHQAVETLWKELMKMGGGWVLEVDLEAFFETLDHGHLRRFLDRRIRDGVLRRAIGKWLKAGVLDEGQLHRPKGGTPQGGVVSPLLANVYLHEVLDKWMEQEVKPRLRGRCKLIRYADDLVILFAREDDALRVRDVLPKRLGKYGLRMHPGKTRLVPFHRPPRGGSGGTRPGSFTFLGFTFYWGKSRKGAWVPKRKTSKESFRRGVRRVTGWLRGHRHWPIHVQHKRLVQMLRGHYAYFGVTGNADPMSRYRYVIMKLWYHWLNRRSHRGRMPWPRYIRLINHRYLLPLPTVVHSVYRHVANP